MNVKTYLRHNSVEFNVIHGTIRYDVIPRTLLSMTNNDGRHWKNI